MASSPASRRSASASPSPARISKSNRFLTMAESSDEEDADILRPRGKMAARMQVRGSTRTESESEPEIDDDARQNEKSQPTSTQGENNDEEEEEEDEIIRPRPRKPTVRRHRSTTPESTTQEPATLSPGKNAPASPGLFISPSKPTDHVVNGDDNVEMPTLTSLVKNPRYMALIEEKRKERLAREVEEARRKAERQQAIGADKMSVDDDEDDEGITDDEGGRKLTQEASNSRPARKASKKALEEMNRETQRMTRNLQLAHEARVKKKLSKASLFERFNFKPQGAAVKEVPQEVPAPASSSRAATPASVQQSDAEMKDGETPPSSPPTVEVEKAATVPQTIAEEDEDLPTLGVLADAAPAQRKLDKGKGKATEADFAAEDQADEKLPRVKRRLRVKFPNPPVQANAVMMMLDDDDLEVTKPTRSSKIDAIFARINPNQKKEPHALSNLRKLAMLDDPEKKAGPVPTKTRQRSAEQKPAMTVSELQVALLQKAKVQAKLERDRHLEILRAKGVHIQTAEEREKEMQQVDDIVARARKEAEEIMERERAAAKKERKENGEDPLDWDDSDYDGESLDEEEVEEEAMLELSGSEDEEEDEEIEGDNLVDDAAEDAEESADEDPAEEDGGAPLFDEDDELPTVKQARRKARVTTAILSDDEDGDEPVVKATPRHRATAAKSPSVQKSDSPVIPTSVLRSATKTFIPGLPVPLAGPAGLGLTQIFQGTMDESEMGSPLPTPSQPRPTFNPDAFPDSNFSQTARDDTEELILNTQPRTTQNAETQGIQIRFSQSQVHGFDSMLRENFDATQDSELLEPTQDSGFKNYTPLKERFIIAPTSTVETLPADASQVAESPLVRRTGKLRRRAEVAVSDAEDEPMENLDEDEFGFGTVPNSNNAFTAMKEAARKEKERKRKEAFDKKKSKAREMVQEQAEESEDEYAGLGGADGEDSNDEANESDKEMIDDETKDNSVDERKLAAFYADRERASDEKQVEKLFHDITTGMLRRKRAGNWDDLSDSDDGGEARRRLKRRQFAKMQRALFADERISKVAENPRNQAFLRTIEDHGSDDDMDFIFAPPPPAPGMESQDSQSSSSKEAAVIIPNSQPTDQAPTAPVASKHPRRIGISIKKPSNLGEIRESLSNLLDEPSYNSSSIIPATELGSDSEEGEEEETIPSSNSSNKENSNPRRTRHHSQSSQIIDRISLKRQSSSTVSTSATKLAFTSTTIDKQGFKVPALLRRATTNSSSTSLSLSGGSVSSTGVTTSNGPSRALGKQDDGMKIKKTAGKKSGVSYLARGNERQAALAETEKRREAKKFKGLLAEGRQNVVKGLLGGGKFE
ncbi:MRC1-like domain-containing protein [Cladorrhinum sp. PSN332]|nr:MRC1-like domain-containing protein [Cladorrhinum sp. PSN332]